MASCWGTYPVYEPLRASMVPEVPTSGKQGEHPATYLPPADENAEWAKFFDRLFDGKISNCWTRQDWRAAHSLVPRLLPQRLSSRMATLSSRLRRFGASRCIIKCIRANLLLGWLTPRFPLRVIYLTRHPCAVVGSRLALQWTDVLDEVVSQPRLEADFLSPFMSIIKHAATPLQRMTVHWCVENLVPLTQLETNPDWITLCYETCVAEPDRTFANLFQQLGLSPTFLTAAKTRVRPSVAAPGELPPWHYPLTPSQGAEVLDICRAFGINLYGRDFFPLSEHRAALSRACAVS